MEKNCCLKNAVFSLNFDLTKMIILGSPSIIVEPKVKFYINFNVSKLESISTNNFM